LSKKGATTSFQARSSEGLCWITTAPTLPKKRISIPRYKMSSKGAKGTAKIENSPHEKPSVIIKGGAKEKWAGFQQETYKRIGRCRKKKKKKSPRGAK